MDGGFASKTVGERAEDDLTEGEPEEHRRDDELDIVPARRPEVVAYGGQRRQHRVGGERGEGHQQADEGHELAGAKRSRATQSASPGVTNATLSPGTTWPGC